MNEMKNYEEFCNVVVESIKNYLPESFAGAEISLQVVMKNNDTCLTGLLIKLNDTNVCPNIYLENFYDKYVHCESMDKILREIAELRIRNDFRDNFDTSLITDYRKAKRLIIPRLINRDMNEALLQDRPYVELEDLAVVYAVELGKSQDGVMSSPVTDELMNRWGATVDEIHKIAVRNLQILQKGTFQGMNEMMSKQLLNELIEEYGSERKAKEVLNQILPPEEGMYYLGCESMQNGADQILNTNLMKQIVETIGPDFYILPSSVHELIIVPGGTPMEPDELRAMVRDVNHEQVRREEQLSFNIYTWTVEDGLKVIE